MIGENIMCLTLKTDLKVLSAINDILTAIAQVF